MTDLEPSSANRNSQLTSLLKVIMQEHVASDRFIEASRLRNQIVKLHSDLVSKHKLALIGRQKSETMSLKNYHQQQIVECKQQWDRKLSMKKEESELALKKMAVEHKELIKLEQKRLENAVDKMPKPSPDLLGLKKSFESAKRHHRLEEAKVLKEKIKNLESAAHKVWERQREERIASKLEHMQQQLDRALDAYKTKLEAGLQELVLKRHKELGFYQRRYLNTLSEVNTSQQMELHKQK
mmetsp:Transcript_30745/g.53830  ORF Transcript_30745/g.53830 Transcript_30745/m.53830 type:complete len:239 (-) Transcript_30745:29-745(-)